MSTIRFSDGNEINTSGPFRVMELFDGIYVVGEGNLIPVGSQDEGERVIDELITESK